MNYSPALHFLKKYNKKILTHRYGATLCIYLGAAVLTGIACVFFMHAFDFVFDHRLNMPHLGVLAWIATPLLFLAAIEIIRIFAPCADGAGIPQTIFAAKHITDDNFKKLGDLVSFKTMLIKIAALLIGVWAGASTGREGPTVHVAACLFFGITFMLHRLFKLPFNMRSAVVAGGAAGLAAAFNTPLAGVTFAIEELSSDYFSSIKDMVLMAIIVAGIAAKTLTGEYIYFGKLNDPASVSIMAIILISFICGASGALFSTVLVKGRQWIVSIKNWQRYLAIVVLALAVLCLGSFLGLKGIAGPGNLAAQDFLHGGTHAAALFSVSKMAATLFTYWSGIAGGIFAPCLAMGSAIGAWASQLQNYPITSCAVMGMAAFLAGTIQAPITSFVIIYEMTGQHQMLLPIMLASLLGYMVSRLLKTKHLYQALAESYNKLLN